MGRAKDAMIENAYEQMIDWMRQTYQIPDEVDIDEDYPGFESMAALYEDERNYQDYQAQFQWYEDHPYHEIYNSFQENMQKLREMIVEDNNPFSDKTLYRMIYAHSVTTFEAMVSDVIKAIILKHPKMMDRLINEIGSDSGKKYTLKDVHRYNGVKGLMLSIINEVTFHNVGKVQAYANALSGEKFESNHIGEMKQLIEIRHDLVHRNGKTIEDRYHNLNAPMVNDAMSVIEKFSEDFYNSVTKGLDDGWS